MQNLQNVYDLYTHYYLYNPRISVHHITLEHRYNYNKTL